MIHFLFVIIELIRNLLWLRRYKRKSVEVGVFRRGLVTLSANFGGKEASPTNHCWCHSSRVIALSCGIKISAVHHLDLKFVTIHKCDRWTDRRTDGRTERQNYDSHDRPRICLRGKNCPQFSEDITKIKRGCFIMKHPVVHI